MDTGGCFAGRKLDGVKTDHRHMSSQRGAILTSQRLHNSLDT
jgi:hypothetical protein